jgi:predicted Ser/Thr protein kinase
MEELKINMRILNQKYVDWSKVLIEPQSLNEARLYALETRLHEEEEVRIKESEHVRDLMKKLVFSLEQTSL